MSFSAYKGGSKLHFKAQTYHSKSTDISSLEERDWNLQETSAINEIISSLPHIDISKREAYRFYAFNNYKVNKAINFIKIHHSIKSKINQKNVLPLLNHGFVYIHRRDKMKRPNVILNIMKFDETRKKSSVTDLTHCILFLCDFVIENYLFIGQVEKFNLIIDIKDWKGNFNDNFKGISNTIINYFPLRIHCVYVINCDDLNVLMWSLLGMSVSRLRVKAFKIDNRGYLNELGKDSLEEKYGGDCDNVEGEFFPPKGITELDSPTSPIKEKTENIERPESEIEDEVRAEIISEVDSSKKDALIDFEEALKNTENLAENPPGINKDIQVSGQKDIRDCSCQNICMVF